MAGLSSRKQLAKYKLKGVHHHRYLEQRGTGKGSAKRNVIFSERFDQIEKIFYLFGFTQEVWLITRNMGLINRSSDLLSKKLVLLIANSILVSLSLHDLQVPLLLLTIPVPYCPSHIQYCIYLSLSFRWSALVHIRKVRVTQVKSASSK